MQNSYCIYFRDRMCGIKAERIVWGFLLASSIRILLCFLFPFRIETVGKSDPWVQSGPDWVFRSHGDRQQTWAAGESIVTEENTWKSYAKMLSVIIIGSLGGITVRNVLTLVSWIFPSLLKGVCVILQNYKNICTGRWWVSYLNMPSKGLQLIETDM